jgi:hypothetical protein
LNGNPNPEIKAECTQKFTLGNWGLSLYRISFAHHFSSSTPTVLKIFTRYFRTFSRNPHE